MACCWAGDKPLSEAIVVLFADAYMRQASSVINLHSDLVNREVLLSLSHEWLSIERGKYF